MNINLDAMYEIAEELYMHMVVREHGKQATPRLKLLLRALKEIYKYVEPEMHKDPIVIFCTLDDNDRPIDTAAAVNILSAKSLSQQAKSPLCIQVLDNGRFLLWNNMSVDLQKLAQSAIVYKYHNKVDTFYAKNCTEVVRKFSRDCASSFSFETFSDLSEALEYYRTNMARHSSCLILSKIWFDSDRIFIKAAQEHVMRDSLTQFLKSRLRGDVEVRPEQIVDDSHPVDIKVTWQFVSRLALIEIKWLGLSKQSNTKKGQKYSDYRARQGAQQLAEYLDENKRQAPTHTTRGYLVLFDGRRYRIGVKTTSVDRRSGLFYADKELDFDPKYHEIRDDFEEPIRMFMEPVCR